MIIEAYSTDTKTKQEAAAEQRESGPLKALVDMVPSNMQP